MSKAIMIGEAPQFPLPFSHAIRAGDFVYVSGQVGVDPATLAVSGNDIESQTIQCFKNLEIILAAEGLTLDHVIKMNAYLSKGEHIPGYNKAYTSYITNPYPARTTVVSGIGDYLVEIDCVAYTRSKRREAQ